MLTLFNGKKQGTNGCPAFYQKGKVIVCVSRKSRPQALSGPRVGDFDAASCQSIGFVASDIEMACRDVSLYDMGNAKEPE